uniref:Uncharacterized protein n=1 Tax=Arundo donax TaxID=35708 RepID=A0A0A9BVA1_ARUDO
MSYPKLEWPWIKTKCPQCFNGRNPNQFALFAGSWAWPGTTDAL